MAEQLIFDLPVRESRARGDFFVSAANRMAVARLDATGNWPNGKLVLVGPEGAGKSHLAEVWAEAEGATRLHPADLAALDVPAIDSPVALDPIEGLTAAGEEPLFHLHNHLVGARHPFLLVARTPPSSWPLALPDLKSRMSASDLVRIEPPDDALLAAVLVKLFADRQLAVAPEIIGWLAARIERSFAEAARVVAALDAAALAEGRAVTRPFARRILDL